MFWEFSDCGGLGFIFVQAALSLRLSSWCLCVVKCVIGSSRCAGEFLPACIAVASFSCV
jgi:hypothetical protein